MLDLIGVALVVLAPRKQTAVAAAELPQMVISLVEDFDSVLVKNVMIYPRLLPICPSPVTWKILLRHSANAALSRQYEAQQFAE